MNSRILATTLAHTQATFPGFVRPGEVRRVAEKYIAPDSLAIVIVGNAEEIRGPLGKLGPPVGVARIEPDAAP